MVLTTVHVGSCFFSSCAAFVAVAKFGAERWEGRGRGEGYSLDVGGRIIGLAGFSRAICMVVVETSSCCRFPR